MILGTGREIEESKIEEVIEMCESEMSIETANSYTLNMLGDKLAMTSMLKRIVVAVIGLIFSELTKGETDELVTKIINQML